MRLFLKFSFFEHFFDGLSAQASRAVLVTLSLCFFIGFADGVLVPFFALWAKGTGISTQTIGLLLACYSGGELLATPLVGGIADRLGRRPVLLVSCLGVGLGFILLFAVHDIIASALVLLLTGAFESVLHPTMYTVIADVVPRERSRYFFSMTRVLSNIGHIAGPAIGALLARHALGTVFLGAGLALLIATLIIALWLPETWHRASQEGQAQEADDEGLSGLLPVFRDIRLASLLLCAMCLMISAGWVSSILPLYADVAGSINSSQVGWLFTYAATLVVLFQMLMTRLFAGVANFWLIIYSGFALVAAFAVLLISPGIPALVIGITLLSLAQMLFGPLLQVTINELAPAHARASYMAAASVMNDLKDTLAPTAGTFLFAISPRLPWLLGMPIAMGAAVALAYTMRRHERGAEVKADIKADTKADIETQTREQQLAMNTNQPASFE